MLTQKSIFKKNLKKMLIKKKNKYIFAYQIINLTKPKK